MKAGEKAPPFSLLGVDAKTHSLDSLKGSKATIIVFSCNHCPYVVKSEDALIAAFNDYKAKGVGMAAINANDSTSHPAPMPAPKAVIIACTSLFARARSRRAFSTLRILPRSGRIA